MKGNALWQELTRQDREWRKLSVREVKCHKDSKAMPIAQRLEELAVGEAFEIPANVWKYKKNDAYHLNRALKDWGVGIKVGLRQISPETFLIIRKA